MAQNPNIDDDTRSRAMKFAAEKAAPKPRVVSKKELEDSGMTLRDFLNKERGLTRRGSSKETDPTAGEAKDRKAQEAADRIDPGSEYPRKIPYNKGTSANDGGKSTVDSQNADIKRKTGMTPAEYVRSGKAAIDKQDADSSFSTDTNKNAADMYTKAALAKQSDEGMAKGGKVRSASSRGDGIAQRGKTRA
jgi:hypothetical protein